MTEFVGFIAAYRDSLVVSGGTLNSTSPVIFGFVGALVTLSSFGVRVMRRVEYDDSIWIMLETADGRNISNFDLMREL